MQTFLETALPHHRFQTHIWILATAKENNYYGSVA
jgi:hypothetical protein